MKRCLDSVGIEGYFRSCECVIRDSGRAVVVVPVCVVVRATSYVLGVRRIMAEERTYLSIR